MTLTQLRYFLAIVRAGSMSAAASQVHIAQPALSQQIRALESELGQSLLRRHARGIALTEAGQRFREHAIDILRRVDVVHDLFVTSPTSPAGAVALGLATAVNTTFSVPVYSAVQAQLPDVKLRMVESMSGHLVEWVQQGRVDMALVYDVDTQVRHAMAESLATLSLGRESLYLIAPPAWREARGEKGRTSASGPKPRPLSLKTVASLPLIVPGFPHTLRMLIDRSMAQAGHGINVQAEIDSTYTIKALVAAGKGFSILSMHSVAPECARGELQAIPLAGRGITRSVDLVTGLHRYTDPAVAAVRQAVSEIVTRGLQGHA